MRPRRLLLLPPASGLRRDSPLRLMRSRMASGHGVSPFFPLCPPTHEISDRPARFSGEPDTPTALDPALRQGRHPSQIACVEILDLASVSLNLRSFSNSARRMPPIVSANLRRKPPLIARRAVYDCAPLHLGIKGTGFGQRRAGPGAFPRRPTSLTACSIPTCFARRCSSAPIR